MAKDKRIRILTSPDFDAYVAGKVDVPTCVLCLKKPCGCPPFGTDEYIALVNARHGRK